MFGYSRYRMMLRISDFSHKKADEIISYLMQHSNVQWLVECGGRWDFLINFMAKNIIHLDFIIKAFKEKFPGQIQNYEILTPIEIIELGRTYFTKRVRRSEVLSYFGREYKPAKVDKVDLKILDLLSENARINSVEASEKIGVTPNTVIQRIKNLREKGVIHAFRPLIHLDNTPYSTYKFPVKFQNISESREKEILDYVVKNVNVIAIIKFIGQWDFEIEFEVDSQELLLDLTRSFRNKFKDVIKEFELIPLFHEYRYNFFPKDLLR
jgi:Lrp/AsnC family leucine-responsive transcriptional regulator